jgi:hypothetical protein
VEVVGGGAVGASLPLDSSHSGVSFEAILVGGDGCFLVASCFGGGDGETMPWLLGGVRCRRNIRRTKHRLMCPSHKSITKGNQFETLVSHRHCGVSHF